MARASVAAHAKIERALAQSLPHSTIGDTMNVYTGSAGSRLAPIAPTAFWQDMCTTDFASVDPARTIALLPVAAVEQHGPHLPLSTDAVINESIVRLMMQRLPADSSVLVLPALTVGDSLEHTAFNGTLSVDLQALFGLWLSIGHSVARAGVRKLVIFNSHGGQRTLVDQVALRLRSDCAMLVVRAHSFALGVPTGWSQRGKTKGPATGWCHRVTL